MISEPNAWQIWSSRNKKRKDFHFFLGTRDAKKCNGFFNSYSSLEVSGDLLTPHFAQIGIPNVCVPMVVHTVSVLPGGLVLQCYQEPLWNISKLLYLKNESLEREWSTHQVFTLTALPMEQNQLIMNGPTVQNLLLW